MSSAKSARTLLLADFRDELVPYDLALQLQETLRTLVRLHKLPDVLLQLQVQLQVSRNI